MAALASESGAWLKNLPLSTIGLCMDDNTIRIATGLRLGASLCLPHQCIHCDGAVDQLGTHGLSCRWIQGRHSDHAVINDIIHCSLVSAQIPSRLEPTGLLRSDGKRPDGMSIFPWASGRHLVWDATCLDTFAASNIGLAVAKAGAVVEKAEQLRMLKYMYVHLDSCYKFIANAVETSDVFGPQVLHFCKRPWPPPPVYHRGASSSPYPHTEVVCGSTKG